MRDEENLQKLLRLKRYEQPPPEYFDKFLRDFQRRQRAELLRQPVWRIALERLYAFFGEQSFERYAYSCATAAVLVAAGMISWNIVGPKEPIASNSVVTTSSLLSKNSPFRFPDYHTAPASLQLSSAHPHYIMDARPVSYEPPGSF